MAKGKYSRIFAIISDINKAGGNVNHRELVHDFTNKRTYSLTDLSYFELQEFERSLRRTIQKPESETTNATDYKNDPLDKTRKAIISQFKSIGRSTADAIAWAEKYGIRGVKKSFNDYNGQELFLLLQNAKKVKSGYIKSVNQKL